MGDTLVILAVLAMYLLIAVLIGGIIAWCWR